MHACMHATAATAVAHFARQIALKGDAESGESLDIHIGRCALMACKFCVLHAASWRDAYTYYTNPFDRKCAICMVD